MLSTDSGFNEEVYLTAAQERMRTAQQLLSSETPDYVTVGYLAGVAVECLFHAYRMRSGRDDMGRHDLRMQAESGSFYDGMSRRQREAVAGLVQEVVDRWQNNHRYRSEKALREFIVRNKLYVVDGRKTTRNAPVEFSTKCLFQAAQEIVQIGVERWQS